MGVRVGIWGGFGTLFFPFVFALAQDHARSLGAKAGLPGHAEINFRNNILSKLDASQQAQCMTAETFKQTIKGVTRTRKVDKMPPGYFYGMLASFSKNVCLKGDTDFEKVLHSKKPQAAKDSLKRFQSLFSNPDPLIQNYALMLPLGMIESDGNFTEGRDTTANDARSTSAEAGLFQLSANVVGAQVPKAVFAEMSSKYGPGRESCLKDIFNKGIKEKQTTSVPGSGFDFQEKMKKCPALAVDVMAYVARKDFTHHGPLLRGEVKPRKACEGVLQQVSDLIKSDKNGSVCDSLEKITGDGIKDYYASTVQGPLSREAVLNHEGGTYNPSNGSIATAHGDTVSVVEPYSENPATIEVEKAELLQKANATLYDDLMREARKAEQSPNPASQLYASQLRALAASPEILKAKQESLKIEEANLKVDIENDSKELRETQKKLEVLRKDPNPTLDIQEDVKKLESDAQELQERIQSQKQALEQLRTLQNIIPASAKAAVENYRKKLKTELDSVNVAIAIEEKKKPTDADKIKILNARKTELEAELKRISVDL